MTTTTNPFAGVQPIETDWNVTFTPYHHDTATAQTVGYRAVRDGLTDLVYLTQPVADAHGTVTMTVWSRPEDSPETDAWWENPYAEIRVDLLGPVDSFPWTDGRAVGWRIAGLHDTRYVYLAPSVGGGTDVADVFVYVSGSDDPADADTVDPWMPVHERTARSTVTVDPVTGPAVTFDPAAFREWFFAPDSDRTDGSTNAEAALLATVYDSLDGDHTAGHRAFMAVSHLESRQARGLGIWTYGPGVESVTVWETGDSSGNDGGAVVNVRYLGVELSCGHLDAGTLIAEGKDTPDGIRATPFDAAAQALAAVAQAVNNEVSRLTARWVEVADPAKFRDAFDSLRIAAADLPAETFISQHEAEALSDAAGDLINAVVRPAEPGDPVAGTVPGWSRADLITALATLAEFAQLHRSTEVHSARQLEILDRAAAEYGDDEDDDDTPAAAMSYAQTVCNVWNANRDL